jgi:hypothetical protein
VQFTCAPAYRVGQINFETDFLKSLRAADISILEFFKIISHLFFTMFPVLWSLFKTVFKILEMNVSKFVSQII